MASEISEKARDLARTWLNTRRLSTAEADILDLAAEFDSVRGRALDDALQACVDAGPMSTSLECARRIRALLDESR